MSMIVLLSGSSPSYIPYAASSDGNDYMSTAVAPTGLADGKQFTCAFWLKMAANDGVLKRIYRYEDNGVTKLGISRNASNFIQLAAQSSSSATTILSLVTNTTITVSSGWVHVYICIDMTSSALAKIYFNGVSQPLTITTYTDDAIDQTSSTATDAWTIFATAAGGDNLNGSLSEFWYNDSYLDDPSKFYDNGGPVDLGATGQLPTGSQPVFYFSRTGSGNSWDTNAGTGGNMTITGSFGSPVAPP